MLLLIACIFVALFIMMSISGFLYSKSDSGEVSAINLSEIQSNQDFELVPSYTKAKIQKTGYKIPFVIHQTHKTRRVPARMSRAVKEWVNKNPEFAHKYYDDDALQDYVYKHGSLDVVKAFDTIKNRYPKKGAMRADLFRLLLMKNEGGVYADCDTTPKISLIKLLKSDDQYLTGVGRKNDFHQWLIICVPNHPFISEALDLAVEAILRDKPVRGGIGREAGFAGPPMLNRAVVTVLKRFSKIKHTNSGVHKIDNNYNYRVIEGDYLGGHVNFKYRGYNQDMKLLGLKHWSSK
ncbi:MAG: hypothetical protein CMO44_12805 [Verrucomicrobiales bacterium]|nr:hypothetical protein [Verrucomicrobiales bacterium]